VARSRKVTVSTDAHGHTAGWAETDLAPLAPPEPDPTAAAFFDVDNTMMQGASIYWFARGLAARKYFTTTDLARFAWQQLRFRVLATEHAGDMSQAKEAALAFVEGWRVDDVERLTEEIFDELMAPRIWGGTRQLAQRHLAAGERVWLVSAAPVEIGRVIAARLGLTGAIGTVAET
jgi:phosphoserine phosphatase